MNLVLRPIFKTFCSNPKSFGPTQNSLGPSHNSLGPTDGHGIALVTFLNLLCIIYQFWTVCGFVLCSSWARCSKIPPNNCWYYCSGLPGRRRQRRGAAAQGYIFHKCALFEHNFAGTVLFGKILEKGFGNCHQTNFPEVFLYEYCLNLRIELLW